MTPLRRLLFPSLAGVAALALLPGNGNAQKGDAAPYPLTTCAVSGEALGSMGDPVVSVYEGREVRFCCGRCPRGFEKDLKASLARLDETIIKNQMPLYPLEVSVVSGEKLGDKGFDLVHGNRLVRLADESEKAAFLKDSKKHLKTLDEAVVEKQSKGYPLTTCPVEGAKLDAKGKPANVVVAGRLVQACCASCGKAIEKDPAKAIVAIDEARKGGSGGGKGTGGHE